MPVSRRNGRATRVGATSVVPEPVPHPALREVDLSERQEWTRAALTIIALLIFLVTLIGAFVLAWGPNWTNGKELLQIFLPVEGTLLGGAGGFYFGTKK